MYVVMKYLNHRLRFKYIHVIIQNIIKLMDVFFINLKL